MTGHAPLVPVSDGTMPCPVPHPDGAPQLTCRKKIPTGWSADEGHPGGHFWLDEATDELLRSGHFNAKAALSGEPFGPHDPADCDHNCPRFWDAFRAKAGITTSLRSIL